MYGGRHPSMQFVFLFVFVFFILYLYLYLYFQVVALQWASEVDRLGLVAVAALLLPAISSRPGEEIWGSGFSEKVIGRKGLLLVVSRHRKTN